MMKGRWLRPCDLIPIGLCLVVAAVVCVWCAQATEGQAVRVKTPTAEYVYELAVDREEIIVGKGGLSLTLIVEDGGAYVRAADCSDQVCVHTGRLCNDGDTAACLPAGVAITVERGDHADVPDAVAR